MPVVTTLHTVLCEPSRDQRRVLGTTYAAFLHYAFDHRAQRFHNHLSFARRWLDEQGSEDCHGRALWALGVAVGARRIRVSMRGRCVCRHRVGALATRSSTAIFHHQGPQEPSIVMKNQRPEVSDERDSGPNAGGGTRWCVATS
jgi:hypothetical protein